MATPGRRLCLVIPRLNPSDSENLLSEVLRANFVEVDLHGFRIERPESKEFCENGGG